MAPFSFIAIAFAITLPLSTTAHAASFDCGAARAPIEHAICDDPELSMLDSELSDAYQIALNGQRGSADQLQAMQRAWLKSRAWNGHIDPAALKSAYRTRIAELKDFPVFPTPEAPVDGPTFRLTILSKQLDFELRMLEACPKEEKSDYTTCEGPAQLLIYDKRQSTARQIINLPNVFVTLPKGRSGPLANSARLYDYQGVINVGDFNFDGYDDFGIQTGNQGSYGGPSYDIYVFNPKARRFVHNDAMTQLIAETLGFFEVDAKEKRLRTFAKDGCCYHEATVYRVERDVPIAVARFIQDARRDDHKLKLIEEKLVNGKWRRSVRYEPMPD